MCEHVRCIKINYPAGDKFNCDIINHIIVMNVAIA